jgi:hypothetical protein
MARARTPRTPGAFLGLLVLLGSAGCGGPLFSAEVVVDRFCFTQALSDLPPMPPTGGQLTVGPLSVPLQLPPGLRAHGSRVVLRLEDGRIDSTSGAFLDGITSLDLLVQPPSGTAVAAAHYARSAGATSVSALRLAGQGVDVGGMVQSDSLQLLLSAAASGPPPATAWNGDLQLCFYGKTVISYF